jgi:hypothetical protein
MQSETRSHPPIVFRRDWGRGAEQPISNLHVALDVITPSDTDCTMRIIIASNPNDIVVSIARYKDIYFTGPPLEIHHIRITKEVLEELKNAGYILPLTLIPDGTPTMWLVSDLGEVIWKKLMLK